jgi:hypothetical protein
MTSIANYEKYCIEMCQKWVVVYLDVECWGDSISDTITPACVWMFGNPRVGAVGNPRVEPTFFSVVNFILKIIY